MSSDADIERPVVEGSTTLHLVHPGIPDYRGTSDIVFIHGPTGDSQSTWTHETGVFWPADLLAQGRGICGSRIWNFAYDAAAPTFLEEEKLDAVAAALVNALAFKFSQIGCKNNNTLSLVGHGLGGLVAQRVQTSAKGVESMATKDINLVLLGTPYFGSRDANAGATDAQLEQVRRFQIVLGAEIPNPEATFRLWSKVSSAVLSSTKLAHSSGWTKTVSFWEGLPSDEQGVILKEEHAKFDGKDMVNCHPDNLNLSLFVYGTSKDPMQFEIQAKHSDLGRFKDAQDPGYFSVHKALAIFHYHGGIMDMIAVQDEMGEDWFG